MDLLNHDEYVTRPSIAYRCNDEDEIRQSKDAACKWHSLATDYDDRADWIAAHEQVAGKETVATDLVKLVARNQQGMITDAEFVRLAKGVVAAQIWSEIQ